MFTVIFYFLQLLYIILSLELFNLSGLALEVPRVSCTSSGEAPIGVDEYCLYEKFIDKP